MLSNDRLLDYTCQRVAQLLVRWKYLVELFSEVQGVISAMQKWKARVNYVRHLGGGMYILIKSPSLHIVFRNFAIKDGKIVPTEKAIRLKFNEWEILSNQVRGINRAYPDIIDVLLCHSRPDDQ